MPANILNLSDFKVQRVEEGDHDYHVYAEVSNPPGVCTACGSDRLIGHGRNEQVIRDLPTHGKRLAIYVDTRRWRCQSCGKTFMEPLPAVNAKCEMTDRLIHTSISGLKAAAALVGSVSFMGNKVDATPLADTFLSWVIYNFLTPLAEVTTWLGRLAFYFGVFLPSLPYTIFMVAVVGWILAVLQSIIAAPLWAVMHMTPDRTFVGSQTQGYLLLLSLFIRPALIITGLFAAMMVANPVVGYISKAFWAMYRSNVTSAESLGWFIEFLQWKNWLIVYGFVLLPVMYMIFGLSQSLPDTVLRWIGAGISSMGETQATEQMRAQSEKYGPSALQGGATPTGKSGEGSDRRLNGDPGNAGSLSGPSGPTGNGGGGRSGGGNYPRLLNANGQGVAPQHDTGNPSASTITATASGPARSSSAASSSFNTGSQGVVSRWASNEITDAEFTEVKDTAPRSKSSADKGTGNAVLALDSRYSRYTTAQASSAINHGTEHGGQSS